MYKFRTMALNADKLEDFLTPEELEQYKKEYKLEHDPRVTGIGNLLRRTSLDELPQILNVIKNDMSLIGPRPVLDEETWLYGKDRRLLLSVKPGLSRVLAGICPQQRGVCRRQASGDGIILYKK